VYFTTWSSTLQPGTPPAASFSSTRVRLCVQEDVDKVLALVDKTAMRLGWFDRYSSLMNGLNVKDIVIGVKNNVIVAAAITYTPLYSSQITSNLPWSSRGRRRGRRLYFVYLASVFLVVVTPST
jgi:hypothetical protein